MTTSENTQKKQSSNEFDIFSEPVPELNADEVKLANTIENKSWILSHMGEENIGRFGMIEGLGFALQCVAPEVLRCILCYKDTPAIKSLALVKETIESVGGRLEIGEFTVLKEYIEPQEAPEENELPAPSGMEVA